MSELEPVEEVWAFAGTRLLNDGKRVFCWVDKGGEGVELLYAAKGTHAVGSLYLARVVRDGETTSLYGTPVFDGGRVEADVAAQWQAASEAAESRLSIDRLERNAKRTSELDDLIDPLREKVRSIKAYREKAALMHYIEVRLLS